jgi:hypothetical protein
VASFGAGEWPFSVAGFVRILDAQRFRSVNRAMSTASILRACLLLLSLAATSPAHAATSASVATTPATDLSGIDGFAFQVGRWRVHHRVLRLQPDGRQQWLEYNGTSSNRAIMGGLVNIEDNLFHTPDGDRRGVAIRSYDRSNGTWAIWWIDERYPHGAMDPPVVGRFVDGVGTFYSDGPVNGRPVRTRFLWSQITPTSARWEQALSYDAGKTWQVNWIMRFQRVAE